MVVQLVHECGKLGAPGPEPTPYHGVHPRHHQGRPEAFPRDVSKGEHDAVRAGGEDVVIVAAHRLRRPAHGCELPSVDRREMLREQVLLDLTRDGELPRMLCLSLGDLQELGVLHREPHLGRHGHEHRPVLAAVRLLGELRRKSDAPDESCASPQGYQELNSVGRAGGPCSAGLARWNVPAVALCVEPDHALLDKPRGLHARETRLRIGAARGSAGLPGQTELTRTVAPDEEPDPGRVERAQQRVAHLLKHLVAVLQDQHSPAHVEQEHVRIVALAEEPSVDTSHHWAIHADHRRHDQQRHASRYRGRARDRDTGLPLAVLDGLDQHREQERALGDENAPGQEQIANAAADDQPYAEDTPGEDRVCERRGKAAQKEYRQERRRPPGKGRGHRTLGAADDVPKRAALPEEQDPEPADDVGDEAHLNDAQPRARPSPAAGALRHQQRPREQEEDQPEVRPRGQPAQGPGQVRRKVVDVEDAMTYLGHVLGGEKGVRDEDPLPLEEPLSQARRVWEHGQHVDHEERERVDGESRHVEAAGEGPHRPESDGGCPLDEDRQGLCENEQEESNVIRYGFPRPQESDHGADDEHQERREKVRSVASPRRRTDADPEVRVGP